MCTFVIKHFSLNNWCRCNLLVVVFENDFCLQQWINVLYSLHNQFCFRKQYISRNIEIQGVPSTVTDSLLDDKGIDVFSQLNIFISKYFMPDVALYISENLTPFNQHLTAQCRELRRANLIHNCWNYSDESACNFNSELERYPWTLLWFCVQWKKWIKVTEI